MEDEPNIQIIYSSYTQAQAKAIKKYRQNNKEKINALQKKYYNDKKNDDAYLQKKRDKSKEYYNRRKNNIPHLII